MREDIALDFVPRWPFPGRFSLVARENGQYKTLTMNSVPQHPEPEGLEPVPGTYALVLHNRQHTGIQVGRRGRIEIRPGYYIYIGSAFGPGGVRARVLRHCREVKSRHWHIDYLRECAVPVAVWCSYHRVRLEHRWARRLETCRDMTPVEGFGCTDCQCTAHLFYTRRKPDPAAFAAITGGTVEVYSCEPPGQARVRTPGRQDSRGNRIRGTQS